MEHFGVTLQLVSKVKKGSEDTRYIHIEEIWGSENAHIMFTCMEVSDTSHLIIHTPQRLDT